MKSDLRQFKLVTGDEIICDVVHEDEYEIVLRNVLQMTSIFQEGYKHYIFKAFMVYQDRTDSLISLNPEKIVSFANPADDLIKEYLQGISKLDELNNEYQERVVEDVMDMYWSGKDSGDNVIQFKPTLH